jgi:GR25 family glycosyltransferase involved in LPS biosynthesis
MSCTHSIKKANSLFLEKNYHEAIAQYLEISSRPGWAPLVQANIAMCRRRLGEACENGLDSIFKQEQSNIVITLTTTRSRLNHLPKVIDSLLHQTLMPARIDINTSREPYLLDEGVREDDPRLLELMKQPLLRVNWVPNIGSYRKIWPLLENHFSKSVEDEMVFITVDDDTIYPDYLVRKLYSKYLIHRCVIAFRGRHIEMDEENIAPYDRWTLGQEQPSHNNLPTGKDGVLYSTKFFTKNFLDLSQAKNLAPTADDLWIKWHCSLNGVPAVILNPEACISDFKSFPLVSYETTDRNNSLYAVHNAPNSQNKNDFAIKQLETHFKNTRGSNLASLLLNPNSLRKHDHRHENKKPFTTQKKRLPRLLFTKKSSRKVGKWNWSALAWKEYENYYYALADCGRLEIDGELPDQTLCPGVAILEGINYTPEMAESVVELMAILIEQKTLRYRFSLASSGAEVDTLPRIDFYLPAIQDEPSGFDKQRIDKNCSHLSNLKKIKELFEKQNFPCHFHKITASNIGTHCSASQGLSLFKEKFLSNCHVLNLAHRTDRMKRVQTVFNTMDLEVNRVNAVFGKDSMLCKRIFEDVIKKYNELTSSEIAPFLFENDAYQNYHNEKSRNIHFAKKQGKLLSLGSLGYLFSYRKALVQGICNTAPGNDYITVFDDDILLHSDWENILGSAYWQLPDNPAVIMLGAIQYHWGAGINWFSENLYCCNGTSIASHATVIHKDYAQFLVDEIEKFTLPFDIGPLHYLKSRLFARSFVIYPNVFIQETSESDIADTKNQSIIGQTKDNLYKWELEKYNLGRV